MTETIKKSDLYDIVSRHSDFDFESFVASTPVEEYDVWNDFCLPLFYSDAVNEYEALRNSCAVFDASPMRKFRINGKDAGLFLDRMLTAPVSQAPCMKASYGLICNDDGFLFDDGILLKMAEDDFLFLITSKDIDVYFSQLVEGEEVVIIDETPDWSGLAIQGPKACAVLKQFGFDDVEHLAPFELRYYELQGFNIVVGRLGFTGDLGYEIWFEPAAKDAVKQAVENAEQGLGIEIGGYGLIAIQICRIQAGMIVPGWDTADTFENEESERTPFELTLGWNVKLGRDGEFKGKSALAKRKEQGPRFKMKGITIPGHCDIEELQPLYASIDGDEVEIGSVPSLIWNEKDNQWIGFASIKTAYAGETSGYVKDNTTQESYLGAIGSSTFVNIEHRNLVPAPF